MAVERGLAMPAMNATAREPEPLTGERSVIGVPTRHGGDRAASSSARRGDRPVRAPRLLPIAATAAAALGAALSLALGSRSMTAAILGWVLAAPVPAVLIVLARRTTLERSASSRWTPRPLDERLVRGALAALAVGALATSLVLGPWFARW